MEIEKFIHKRYESIDPPRIYEKFKHSGMVISYSEGAWESTSILNEMICIEAVVNYISNGWDEPPDYEIIHIGELLIRPTMKYWGKGKRDGN